MQYNPLLLLILLSAPNNTSKKEGKLSKLSRNCTAHTINYWMLWLLWLINARMCVTGRMYWKSKLARACGVLAVDCWQWRSGHVFPPSRPFLGAPWRPFWILMAVRRCRQFGGAELQAVQCCRRCGIAGGEQVPPSPSRWQSSINKFPLLY